MRDIYCPGFKDQSYHFVSVGLVFKLTSCCQPYQLEVHLEVVKNKHNHSPALHFFEKLMMVEKI